MICAFFSKAFADSFLQAIQQGKAIAPPPDPVTGQRGWTGNNMLSLAGLLFAAASRKDPCEFRDRDVIVDAEPVVTALDRERVRTLHEAELHSALDFLSCVAFAVWDGQYPPSWDAEMTGWIDEEYDPQYLRLFPDEEPRRSCRPRKKFADLVYLEKERRPHSLTQAKNLPPTFPAATQLGTTV